MMARQDPHPPDADQPRRPPSPRRLPSPHRLPSPSSNSRQRVVTAKSSEAGAALRSPGAQVPALCNAQLPLLQKSRSMTWQDSASVPRPQSPAEKPLSPNAKAPAPNSWHRPVRSLRNGIAGGSGGDRLAASSAILAASRSASAAIAAATSSPSANELFARGNSGSGSRRSGESGDPARPQSPSPGEASSPSGFRLSSIVHNPFRRRNKENLSSAAVYDINMLDGEDSASSAASGAGHTLSVASCVRGRFSPSRSRPSPSRERRKSIDGKGLGIFGSEGRGLLSRSNSKEARELLSELDACERTTPATDAVGAGSSSAASTGGVLPLALIPARARGGSGGNWGDMMAGRRVEETAVVAAAVAEEGAEVVMGILWKWVNLGRGWGMRLFVLEGGVLSYFKLEGPDRVTVLQELDRRPRARLIGDEIRHFVKKEREDGVVPTSGELGDRMPHGSVRLEVSTLRASTTDGRKFYVFGTKTLGLRTESKAGRLLWMDALQAAKVRHLQSLRASAQAPSIQDSRFAAASTLSMEPLRAYLASISVGMEEIAKCEEIVRRQVVFRLENKLREEQRRRLQLLRLLRQLEADKVELETAMLEETRNQGYVGNSVVMTGDGDDVSTTFDEDEEEEDEEEGEEGEEEEEAEGGDQEVDSSVVTTHNNRTVTDATVENPNESHTVSNSGSGVVTTTHSHGAGNLVTMTSDGLLKRSGSGRRMKQAGNRGSRSGRARSKARRAAVLARDNDEDEEGSGSSGGQDDEFFEAMDDFVSSGSVMTVLDMQEVGFTHPKITRRDRLPPPAEEEKPVSIWSILKDLIGKDLFKVSLPVSFNEPISTNQKYCETFEYSWLLDRAAEYGRRGNRLMRAVHVAAFAVSRYSGNAGRMHKPFNPLLGETFEADYPDKGFRYISEAVLHYPPTLAWHCEGTGWRSWGDACLKVRFWGPSVQLDPVGVLSVQFDDGEVFEWSNVTVSIQNLILGKPFVDHYGTMRITGNRGFSARLRFKERSTFDRNPHQVRGLVQSDDGEEKATLVGRWDQFVHLVPGELSSKSQKEESEVLATAQLLWQKCTPSVHPCKYKFTPFCITLNEITPGLKEQLPPTDSRLRADQRALEEGYYDLAIQEKSRLEQKQRKALKAGEPGWHPRWFQQQGGPGSTWTYVGGYWERRGEQNWTGIKEIFADDDAGCSQVQQQLVQQQLPAQQQQQAVQPKQQQPSPSPQQQPQQMVQQQKQQPQIVQQEQKGVVQAPREQEQKGVMTVAVRSSKAAEAPQKRAVTVQRESSRAAETTEVSRNKIVVVKQSSKVMEVSQKQLMMAQHSGKTQILAGGAGGQGASRRGEGRRVEEKEKLLAGVDKCKGGHGSSSDR